MIDATTLGLFSLACLALLLSPGPNLLFVLGHGTTYGFKAAFAASLGIFCTDLILTAITALGLSAAVSSWPPTLLLLRYGGASYLAYLAYRTWQQPLIFSHNGLATPSTPLIFSRALGNSLLNPKALIFFMLFLPQFVQAENGPVPTQLWLLGLTLSAFSIVVNSSLGALAASVQRYCLRHPQFAIWQTKGLAVLLGLLALRLLIT